MRLGHASHEIIALHKFEKSYYLLDNKHGGGAPGRCRSGSAWGWNIPTRYSEPHTPPPNALRSIDDTPPPKSSITINDAHRILLPRWALFFCSPKSVYVAWAYAQPANRQMAAQTTGGITFHRPKAACDSIRPLPKQQGWRKGGQKPAAIGNCLGTLGSYRESTSCGKHLLAALCK